MHVATEPLEAWRSDLGAFSRRLRRKGQLVKARLRRQSAPFGFGTLPAHRDFRQPAAWRIARDRLADRGTQRHMGSNAGEAGEIDPRTLELELLRPVAGGACVAVAEVEGKRAPLARSKVTPINSSRCPPRPSSPQRLCVTRPWNELIFNG
jgi:hypothetical protein